MAGKLFLRADYRIVCYGDEWAAFLPAVLVVLIGFTVALPASIGLYLWKNRGELYSTRVFQTVGFLFSPYNRGAEFWQLHDVILKMVLTGLILYIPEAERAGVAALCCALDEAADAAAPETLCASRCLFK